MTDAQWCCVIAKCIYRYTGKLIAGNLHVLDYKNIKLNNQIIFSYNIYVLKFVVINFKKILKLRLPLFFALLFTTCFKQSVGQISP